MKSPTLPELRSFDISISSTARIPTRINSQSINDQSLRAYTILYVDSILRNYSPCDPFTILEVQMLIIFIMCFFTVVIHIRLNCACHSSSKFVIEMTCARFSSHRPVLHDLIPIQIFHRWISLGLFTVRLSSASVRRSRERERETWSSRKQCVRYTIHISPTNTLTHANSETKRRRRSFLSLFIFSLRIISIRFFFLISPTKCSHVF